MIRIAGLSPFETDVDGRLPFSPATAVASAMIDLVCLRLTNRADSDKECFFFLFYLHKKD